MPYAHLLPELERIITEAGKLALEERARMEHRLKPDGSIVTTVDDAVEAYIDPLLVELLPGSTVWGEESGFQEEGPEGLWVVDPIDGTSNFTFGSPIWGVSVALVKGEHIELGAVFVPELHELYLSARGHGVTLNGEQLPPIPPGKIEPFNLVSYNDTVVKHVAGSAMPGKMRCGGAFVVDAAFALSQRYRGMIGMKEKLYDMAACVLMGRELGADIRYADGDPLVISKLKKDEKVGRPWIIFPRESGFYLGGGR